MEERQSEIALLIAFHIGLHLLRGKTVLFKFPIVRVVFIVEDLRQPLFVHRKRIDAAWCQIRPIDLVIDVVAAIVKSLFRL